MKFPHTEIASETQRVSAARRFIGGRCAVASMRSPDKSTANEDTCLLLQFDQNSGVIAIADGAGGHVAGAEASKMAIDCLQQELGRCPEHANLRAPILNAIETCNRQLLADGRGAATTLAVVEIHGATIRHYHVGDSSIIVAGQRGLVRLQTVPQSLVGYGIEAGLLHEDAALEHEERHVVLNLLGTPDMRVEIGAPLRLQRFDTLLLCSDGLTDNVTVSDAVEQVRKGDLARALAQLTELAQHNMALDNGHPDDLTVVLYRQGR